MTLHRTILDGDAALVLKLLNEGADVNYHIPSGVVTPLYVASLRYVIVNVDGRRTSPDYLAIVRLLLAYGADANAPITTDGMTTLLHLIAFAGRDVCRAMAELLIRYGAEVDRVDRDGYTPLFWACRNRHVDLVEVLLQNGANINRKFPAIEGANTLLVAVSIGDVGLVHRLVRYGAT